MKDSSGVGRGGSGASADVNGGETAKEQVPLVSILLRGGWRVGEGDSPLRRWAAAVAAAFALALSIFCQSSVLKEWSGG